MFYGLIVAGFLLEALMYWRPVFKRFRQPAALAVIITSLPALAVVVYSDFSIISLLLMYVGLWRAFNLARIVRSRLHEQYLKSSASRSSAVFVSVMTILMIAGFMSGVFGVELVPDWRLLAYAQTIVGAVIIIMAARNIRRTRHVANTTHFSDKELPTVSVLIPARNETHDLEACLKSLLANDYPKLEIIVLDDCSHDRTAQVIKSFAHAGVRFIRGTEPSGSWLAKNRAYQELMTAANGELVLFCGVDVRFGPRAVRALVTTLLNRKKEMISVLPRRFYGPWTTAFIQPMRYWWELVPPRRFFNRPPVLSTCWLARRQAIDKVGGFEAVRQSIIPEGFFAREFVKSDAYSFIRADQELDVQTVKSVPEQRDTAIRVRYPQIRKRPELAFLLTTFQAVVFFMPFLAVPAAFLAGQPDAALVSGIACLLLIGAHVLILQVSNPANVPLAFVNLPAVVMTEICLGLISMYRYEFSVVEWKGRNICIPVMDVIPKLPTIDKTA